MRNKIVLVVCFSTLLLFSCQKQKSESSYVPVNTENKDNNLSEINYNKALEYYSLVVLNEQNLDEQKLREKDREYWLLFMDYWDCEVPDTIISPANKKEIEKAIVKYLSGQKTREKWEKLEIKCFGGNHCYADILFFNRGPLAAAGSVIFLIKYNGKWEVLKQMDWES